MKFSKSGILTLSGMLIANSFLLLATAYATEEKKDITASPANAKQNIQEIILSNGAEKNICTMLLFDVSGSMFDEKINGETKRLKGDNRKNGKKRTNAISGTIEYSELLLKYYPTAKIGLVLFGDTAKLTQKLSNTPFSIADFPVPETDEWTRLDLGIKKARAEFKESYASGCTIKNIIIISDGEPQGYGITKEDASEKALNQTLSGKIEGINFYSIGYNVETFGRDILRSISAGGFYEAEVTTIKTILENMIINNGSSILSENNKLKINTQNFIITTGGEIDNNEISNNSNGSNILGGKGNRVSASSSLSTIIAGKTNSIQTSDSSSILGGRENQITQGDPKSGEGLGGKSSIIGGYLNKIVLGNYSVIGGGKSNTIEKGSHSTIIGNSGHITNGNYSVAMGKRTTISDGDNSFYWTDGENRQNLTESNVFSVVSKNGMVINTNTPNARAKLTISGNLAIRPNSNDESIVCNSNGKGIIKAVKKTDGEECLCSCNGSNREPLYIGICEGICNNNINPECGSSVTFNETQKTYNGNCISGSPISTSYFVDNNNTIYRACQTHDGKIANCTGTI